MELVPIPAGEFLMGSNKGFDDERPAHRVRISEPFYMGKYEVTQAQWEAGALGDSYAPHFSCRYRANTWLNVPLSFAQRNANI
jgi:formylglycine-generating enzyme required for sulfatase activity